MKSDKWRRCLLLQARIAELEDELEQERAARVKVSGRLVVSLSVSTKRIIVDVTDMIHTYIYIHT